MRLRDKMREDLRVRNYAAGTQDKYVDAVAKFVAYCGKAPARIGQEEIRRYQLHLVDEKGASWTTLNQAVCALRFFYGTTLGREWSIRHIPYARSEKPLPVVLSQKEIAALLMHVADMKYLAMLLSAYSAGLRVSEVAHLKVEDIDSDRMVINVRRGKGRKDRTVPLSPILLGGVAQLLSEPG